VHYDDLLQIEACLVEEDSRIRDFAPIGLFVDHDHDESDCCWDDVLAVASLDEYTAETGCRRVHLSKYLDRATSRGTL